ncbi:predicted protein [Uncinocarpus reesii 1704]|uniref:Uncharacterized protein n=1 Tax=Uncinocarpus reesii (strain UAMH 1704) TaxID=336963 RepID=C4JS64_UNCRE|nr:uncharacterized protein UREG_05303 [Uncinocarpus reesii 1704]EEP80461.1 predicted protein [Uncinocarpus reesii 1704]
MAAFVLDFGVVAHFRHFNLEYQRLIKGVESSFEDRSIHFRHPRHNSTPVGTGSIFQLDNGAEAQMAQFPGK